MNSAMHRAVLGQPRDWQGHVAAWLAIVAASVITFWPSWVSIFDQWLNNRSFNHCLLILPISAYLVWRKRELLAGIPLRVWMPGIAVLAGQSLIWLASWVLDINLLQHLMIISVIPVALLTVTGIAFCRPIVFPLVYTVFAIPFGKFLVPDLQDFTASFSVALLRLSDIPVFFEGLYISIPTGNFVVAEACSGINYLIASVALSTLYAYLQYQKTYKRVLFIAASVVVPIIANGLRAYGIVVIAYLSNHKYAVGVDHILYGWLFFGLVLFLMFWAGGFFRDPEPEPEIMIAGVPASTAGSHQRRLIIGTFAALLVFATAGLIKPAVPGATDFPELDLPEHAADWTRLEEAVMLGNPRRTAYQKSAWELQAGAQPVFAEVSVYFNRAKGGDLTASANSVFAERLWQVVGMEQISGPGELLSARKLRGVAGVEIMLVHFFVIDGEITARRIPALLQRARLALLDDPGISYGITLFTPVSEDEQAARTRLETAIKESLPGLVAAIESGDPRQ